MLRGGTKRWPYAVRSVTWPIAVKMTEDEVSSVDDSFVRIRTPIKSQVRRHLAILDTAEAL